MKKILLIIFFVFLISLTLISKNESFAQNITSEKIVNIEKDLDDFQNSVNKKISDIDKKQTKILEKLEENEIHVGTTAKNIDESLRAASKSFWYSSSLTNIVTVSLPIFAVVVTIWLTNVPVTKIEWNSRKYAVKWSRLD